MMFKWLNSMESTDASIYLLAYTSIPARVQVAYLLSRHIAS